MYYQAPLSNNPIQALHPV